MKLDIVHRCPFCEFFNKIEDERWMRIMHNLVVMAELEVHHRVPYWEMLKMQAGNYYRLLETIAQYRGTAS